VGDLELIATLAGKERYRGVCVSALAIDDSRVLPGDLFVGKDGFVPILGWRDKRPIAVNGTRADLDGAFLVRRDLAWGNPQRTLIDSNDVICVSLMAADIAHTGFLQCDEVDIAGEKAVVVGCDDSYVWMVSADGHFFCTNETLADNDVTLVRRPTDNPSILFDCFVKSVGK
jgi:hypothetical protein